MKKLILILSIFFYTGSHVAFSQEFQDLLLLYVDERYDKCFSKSIKYTESDKTKKHPLPYLYASMSSFGMSQDHRYSKNWPKAYKTALSFAAKYRKKDPDNTYKEDSQEYIDKLKGIILEEIENYMLDGTEKGYKKAVGIVKKVCAFDPHDFGAILLRGQLEILTKNKTEGKKLVIEGFRLIRTIGTDIQFADLNEMQQMYLKKALMEYAIYQRIKDPSGAGETISLGHTFFYEKREDCLLKDNEDFKTLYDEITG